MDIIKAAELMASYKREGVIDAVMAETCGGIMMILCPLGGLQIIAKDTGATIEMVKTGGIERPGRYWGMVKGDGVRFEGLCYEATE